MKSFLAVVLIKRMQMNGINGCLKKYLIPKSLRKTVEEQVIFHKLTKIPYEDLIIDVE